MPAGDEENTRTLRVRKIRSPEFLYILQRIDGLDRNVSGRFDSLDQKLTTRLDAVDGKLSDRIDALTGRIDALGAKLSGRIDAVDERLEDLRQEVKSTEVCLSLREWFDQGMLSK